MSALVSPIHTGTINGHPVRFFRSPRSPRPEMPWHSVDDLHRAVKLPRAIRQHFLRSLRNEQWNVETARVATEEGITTIATHVIAQGFLSAMTEVGYGSEEIEREYCFVGVEAFKKLTGDLPPMASFEWSIAAFRNTNGLKPGETFDSTDDKEPA